MNFEAYHRLFDTILNNPAPAAPYDNPDYFNYTKLNASRSRRWLKNGVLSEELKTVLKAIDRPMKWIVITEPWCGDASHIVPFIHLMSQENPLIEAEYELRDQEPFRINDYLTNGSKSIPKLVIRDAEGNDLAVWGPRPEGCQELYDRLKKENADFETLKIELQQWYNNNEGKEIQEELMVILKAI